MDYLLGSLRRIVLWQKSNIRDGKAISLIILLSYIGNYPLRNISYFSPSEGLMDRLMGVSEGLIQISSIAEILNKSTFKLNLEFLTH